MLHYSMKESDSKLNELKSIVKNFIEDREWEQFHSPKNLAMSISIEASELMELFQWLSLEESVKAMETGDIRSNAIDEIADVLIYAITFCNQNNIDIYDAIKQKVEKNIKKYPINSYKGNF